MRDLKEFPLRMGVLGCGGFLLRRVLPIHGELQGVQIVCIQNRDLAKAQKIAAEYRIPYAVSNRQELLANPEVEAVHIASPNFLHEEDALACAEAGKPTLCEKPLSISLESVTRMLQAFQKRSIPFFVGHQLRFKPAILKAKQLLQEGVLGRLLHLRAYYYSQTIPSGNWRLQKGNGGGALQEIGIHLVDLIHFITGEEICDVHAVAMPTHPDLAEQMVSFQGRLPSGALVSFECSFKRPYYSGFEVIGTKARLVSSESLRQTTEPIESLFLVSGASEKIELPLRETNLYVEEFKHFAESVTQKVPSVLSAEISCASQRVVDMAYRELAESNACAPIPKKVEESRKPDCPSSLNDLRFRTISTTRSQGSLESTEATEKN